MNSKPIICIDDLCFSYNGKETMALDGLSIEIPEASVTTILGPNGSGKTTLLFVLLGMLRPQRGTILFDGRSRSEHQGCRPNSLIGLVPQEEHIPFEFSVREYVLLGRAPHLGILQTPNAQDYRVAQRAMETTGLRPFADRSVSSLSGGERQLATIARAVAQMPRILLLDEPTSHLDLSNTQRVLELVRRKKKIRRQFQDGFPLLFLEKAFEDKTAGDAVRIVMAENKGGSNGFLDRFHDGFKTHVVGTQRFPLSVVFFGTLNGECR